MPLKEHHRERRPVVSMAVVRRRLRAAADHLHQYRRAAAVPRRRTAGRKSRFASRSARRVKAVAAQMLTETGSAGACRQACRIAGRRSEPRRHFGPPRWICLGWMRSRSTGASSCTRWPCAVTVTLLCGLLPAIRTARGGLAGASNEAGRTQVSTRNSLQWLLVGAQVALSVTLLAGCRAARSQLPRALARQSWLRSEPRADLPA